MAVLSIKAVSQALDKVFSVGQAQSAARAALAEYDALHPAIAKVWQYLDNPFSGFSWTGLDRAAKAVRDLSGAMQGPPGQRIRYRRPDGGPGASEPSWSALHAAIQKLYVEIYAAQVREPAVSWRDAQSILWQSIQEAPGVFARTTVKVAKGVASTAGEVAAGVAGAAGSTVWALLRPLLPVIGVVVVLGVVALVVVSSAKGKVGL